jgi:hypothetical protein
MLCKILVWAVLVFGWCVMVSLFVLGISYLLLSQICDGWLRRTIPARPTSSLVKRCEVVKLLRN